ncbi:MAG: hypothetical protein KKE23_01275 [Nanoarchaeota archaeon]|nr:hypothetical protein [Nanoarchaeota archaeon]
MTLEDKFPPVIKKRDGTVASFDISKTTSAIFKAAMTVGGQDRNIAESLAKEVARRLSESYTTHGSIPTVDDSNQTCIDVLREKGFDGTANSFWSYSQKRSKIREQGLFVKKKNDERDLTDRALLVQSITSETREPWSREKMIDSFKDEYNLSDDLATMIAKETEINVYDLSHKYNMRHFDTALVRKLSEIHIQMKCIPVKESSLSIPFSTLESLVYANSKENSNITANNPEAINLGIAEYILKQYNLKKVFSEEVSDAHNSGMVHIHDLGYPQRVYCSGHSIEYIKKYGLDKVLPNLQNKSHPAKSATVLGGHIQTFLAAMQSRYAGALGFGFMNILFAPMLYSPEKIVNGELEGKKTWMRKKTLEEHLGNGQLSHQPETDTPHFNKTGEAKKLFKMSREGMKQVAQNLIFSESQNAFSRGGQTLFIDFNIHTGVPEYMKNVPVVGPGGKYLIEDAKGNIKLTKEDPRYTGVEGDPRNGDIIHPTDRSKYITYGDPRMVKTSQEFAIELMKVWADGDKYGKQFAFPKCDLHIGDSTLENLEEREVFKEGCRLASKNGSTYFMFDREGVGANLAQCCRLKDRVTDPYILKRPELIRFTGAQNVTINLPQTAYRSKNGLEGVLKNIDIAMKIAVKAHLQKKEYIEGLLKKDGSALRSMGLPSDDGNPYIDMQKATYIIGLIGLNEAVQYLTGKELHESKEAYYETGLKIIDHMNQNVQEYKQKYGLKFTLEESPAESATQKLAKGDLSRFKEAKRVIKGDLKKAPYYTNSVHLNPGAEVSIIDRIDLQSKFHDMIESGSIIHVYCGEHQIPPESIENLVEKTYRNTRASQITISPEFTHCNVCHTNYFGFKDKCEKDGSTNVTKRTKIVGYFSDLGGWNNSQLEISKAREKVSHQYANMASNVSWLHEPSESNRVMVFGKDDCHICHDAKNYLEKSMKELGINAPVEFYDMALQKNRIKAAKYNIPLDQIPTIVTQNGSIIKYEPKFRHGKMIRLDENHYSEMLKKSFKR